ncbi:VPA1267 family protein [Massilia sp. LC238]|uniref:VPA1267 family protein n=1 Tax=Massilia sp. LC238 TaxID=1502852 RepID=UPI0004E3CBD9|nr:VPA1267 family protein [Massilia sp. LC238]KFC76196.1 hypothetical protein FG94_00288 [Massilia sp. LC238]
MTDGRNGQQIAIENVERFRAWIKERDRTNDWADYVRGDKLSRIDIAHECGFAVSVLRQNPTVKGELSKLEARLRTTGLLDPVDSDVEIGSRLKTPEEIKSEKAANRRAQIAKAGVEQRVKTLEEQNAALKAQVTLLQDLLKKYKFLADHLFKTGRLVQ